MERNTNDDLGFTTGAQSGAANSGTGGSPSTGSSSGGTADSQSGFSQSGFASESASQDTPSYSSGSAGSTGTDSQTSGRADSLKAKAGDRFGTVKERATELKATLADKLEAGAEKLRQRGSTGGGTAAYASTAGAVAATDDRMSQVNDTIARGLQGTAEFLREGDLQATIENQVKEHPGRTLLLAVGLGYLLGKALRK